MARMIVNCCGKMSLVLIVLLVPALAFAENINLVRTAEMGVAEQIVARKVAGRNLLVGLDENGDVTIYYRKVSLTMSYNPADIIPQARERVVLNAPLEPSAVGGFGVKVGFAF